jgi:UDP-glucuronate 4-epimerase
MASSCASSTDVPTVLITGANGFLGARCVQRLADVADHQVIALWNDRSSRLLSNPPEHIRYERCDLTDRNQTAALFGRHTIDAVVHTAARLPDGSSPSASAYIETNALATASLAGLARGAACKRFVYCSSISAYGSAPCPASGWTEDQTVAPTHSYGRSKHAGEECVRRACEDGEGNFSGVAMRLAGLHGPGRTSGVIYNSARQALAGHPIALHGSAQPFQLLYLDDAVDALLAALRVSLPTADSVVNVASGTASLMDLAKRVVELSGSRSRVAMDVTSDERQFMNTTRMRSILGVTPRDSDQQLRGIIDWVASA